METTTSSFSTHVPFKQPLVITHLISMVIAFLGCYPLLLTQQLKRQKNYILFASLFFASIGFISGSFIQLDYTNTTSILFHLVGFLLFVLVLLQLILYITRSTNTTTKYNKLATKKIPKWIDLTLGWFTLLLATSYLTLAALVFTESCSNDILQSQCLMPVAMGTGFLIYGTITLLHLLAIIKLPRPSTPEYYEGVILTFWGFISLFLSGTPILGTAWRAINLGLLWFTGGLFSISLSVQTWIPALRERNIINALIICLTGRAIITGLTEKDDVYANQVHTVLGWILIIGAIARSTQIIFRKSPVDNLPHRMFQQNTDTTTLDIDDEEEDDLTKDLKEIPRTKCRHVFIFATITLISGLLSSLLSICAGILFMGSNIGWIRYMKYYIQDPSTYINITLAIAFLWSAYVFGLCTLYKNLKALNAIHQYEYLELENNNIIVEQSRYLNTSETARWSSTSSLSSSSTSLPPPVNNTIPTTNTNNSSAIMMSTSPTTTTTTTSSATATTTLLQQQQQQDEILNSPIPLYFHAEPSTTTTNEKTIRPSEYRAKRRSLLVQSPILNAPPPSNNRARSSSNFGGVGGILPDEIINLQKGPTTDTNRRSWLSSSGSSISSSSGPNSPSFDQQQQRPYSSISSTLPLGLNKQYTARRNSVNHNQMMENVIIMDQDKNDERTTSINSNSSKKQQHWSSESASSGSSSRK